MIVPRSGSGDLFGEIEGGQSVIDWFGFVPSFHDATLARINFGDGFAELELRAFRMTREIDERGYFKTDKHTSVTIHLEGVTGVALTGNASTSIISELRIRKLADEDVACLRCDGPERGDFEVAIESSYGLDGALYARALTMALAAT